MSFEGPAAMRAFYFSAIDKSFNNAERDEFEP